MPMIPDVNIDCFLQAAIPRKLDLHSYRIACSAGKDHDGEAGKHGLHSDLASGTYFLMPP